MQDATEYADPLSKYAKTSNLGQPTDGVLLGHLAAPADDNGSLDLPPLFWWLPDSGTLISIKAALSIIARDQGTAPAMADDISAQRCANAGDPIMTSDAALRSDIEEELDFEPSLDASGIGISVKEGVATLTGHVSSYAQKIIAEKAAGRVKDIRAVAEEMTVRLPLDARHNDDEIALRAANLLAWTLNVPDDTVHIKIEKGWVTLTGDVDWQYQKQSAELAVRRLGGVMGLSNTINIRPHATVKDVRAHITEAFRRNAELESSGITVLVEGGKITLSGRVKALHERRAAENAAWGVSSVTEVVDNLIVA